MITTFKIFETLQNIEFVRQELKKMLMEFQSFLTIRNDNFKVEKRQVYWKLELINIESLKEPSDEILNQVRNIFSKYKQLFEDNNIIFEFKEQKTSEIDILDNFEFEPTGKFYYNYIFYVKDKFTTKITPNRFVYHYSKKENRENILKNGLIPKSSKESSDWNKDLELSYPNAIFAINDDENVWRPTDKWKIDTTNLNIVWYSDLNFTNRKEFIMTFEPIPPEYLELM